MSMIGMVGEQDKLTKERLMVKNEDILEARRLLGFAQFNLAKGKFEATKTLVDKALIALDGQPWYNHDPNSPGEGFRRGGYLGDAID